MIVFFLLTDKDFFLWQQVCSHCSFCVVAVLLITRTHFFPYNKQNMYKQTVILLFIVIIRALSKLVDKKPKEWDKHLDAVMFGLRTKKQMTTKYSPFFLMFGREARYPSEVPEQYRVRVYVHFWHQS